jgi:uncharacterized LabA/DUF88 family protein
MNVKVDDYEVFYRYIFEQAVGQWQDTMGGVAPPAQLRRVYWYVVGEMDEWDLENDETVDHLKKRFNGDTDLKKKYMALAGQDMPNAGQPDKFDEAFDRCLSDFSSWYEGKVESLAGMKRFHHAVRRSTSFIDIVECGHWKVDFSEKSLSEKGLDTQLAVDMIALKDNFDVALVITGDADSIPSIEYLKRADKHVAAVEFVSGYPPSNRGRGFSSHLKLSADFVTRIYEMDLVNEGIAEKEG